jgi:hypothetical protein
MDSMVSMISAVLGIFQILSLVIAIVWTVGKINATTQVLNASVQALSTAVAELKGVVMALSFQVNEHGNRLSRLEVRFDEKE